VRWIAYFVAAQLWAQGPVNPGGAESSPGSGCEIGTSGCWPSSPPGPVDSKPPPDIIDPKDVPFYGDRLGDQPIASPKGQQELQAEELQRRYDEQQQKQAERDEQQRQRDERLEQLVEQQQEIIEQLREEKQQQQPEPSPAP
jgi:hypothetical protein